MKVVSVIQRYQSGPATVIPSAADDTLATTALDGYPAGSVVVLVRKHKGFMRRWSVLGYYLKSDGTAICHRSGMAHMRHRALSEAFGSLPRATKVILHSLDLLEQAAEAASDDLD